MNNSNVSTYLINTINEDEKLIMVAKINKKEVMALILALSLFLISIAVFFVVLTNATFAGMMTGMTFIIIIVTLIKELPTIIVRMYTTELAFTEKRIIGKKGFTRTITTDIPINRVTNVSVKQNLPGQLFNYGTIIIMSSSIIYGFENIDNPYEFKRQLVSLVNKEK